MSREFSVYRIVNFVTLGVGVLVLGCGLNIFNFLLITSSPILFKFGMKHLWDKGHINCKFQISCPPGALGRGKNCPKVTNFQKSSS